jgi:hypothetical protein
MTFAEEAAAKLERCFSLFEMTLQEAERNGRLPELKEFVACLSALERALKIANLARAISEEKSHDATGARLDPDALRRLLSEED